MVAIKGSSESFKLAGQIVPSSSEEDITGLLR